MIPGLSNIIGSDTAASKFGKIGDLISALLDLTIILTAFLMFIWMVWGAFEYIFAGGDKEKLGKAQKRLTWAVVGFLLIAVAYFISHLMQEILSPAGVSTPNIINVTNP
jgi:hypothetical protein